MTEIVPDRVMEVQSGSEPENEAPRARTPQQLGATQQNLLDKLQNLSEREEMEVAQAVGAAWEPGIPHEVQLVPTTGVVAFIKRKMLEQRQGYVRTWWEDKALPGALAQVLRVRLERPSQPQQSPRKGLGQALRTFERAPARAPMRKADERESIQSPIPGVPGDEQWLDKFEQELGYMTKRLEDLKRKRVHEESPRKRPAMEGTPQDNPMAGEHNEHLGLTEWSVGSGKQQITISKVDKDKECLRAVQISNIKEVPMQQLYRALINMFGTPTLGFTPFTEQAKKGKVVLMTTAERMRAVLPIPGEKEVTSVQLESTTIMAEAVEVPEAVVARQLAGMVPPVPMVKRQSATTTPAPRMFMQAPGIVWSTMWPFTAMRPFLSIWGVGEIVTEGVQHRMAYFMDDQQCMENRETLCRRYEVWGIPQLGGWRIRGQTVAGENISAVQRGGGEHACTTHSAAPAQKKSGKQNWGSHGGESPAHNRSSCTQWKGAPVSYFVGIRGGHPSHRREGVSGTEVPAQPDHRRDRHQGRGKCGPRRTTRSVPGGP